MWIRQVKNIEEESSKWFQIMTLCYIFKENFCSDKIYILFPHFKFIKFMILFELRFADRTDESGTVRIFLLFFLSTFWLAIVKKCNSTNRKKFSYKNIAND